MPIKVYCDTCGREMGETSLITIKKFHKKHGETCKECLEIHEHIKDFIVNKKSHYSKKIDKMIKKTRADTERELKRILKRKKRKWFFTGLFSRKTGEENGECNNDQSVVL